MNVFDVGVIAGERRHHRAAPRPGRHDGAAHRVPHFHERDGAGRIRAHAFDGRALGPKGREVVADAAALLHGQRRFAKARKDAAHVVRDGAHHIAIEEGDIAVGARAGEDAAGGQELMPGQGLGEGQRPFATLLGRFGLGGRQRHARPGIGQIVVHGRPVGRLQPVFHVPDLAGNVAHGRYMGVRIPPPTIIARTDESANANAQQSQCLFVICSYRAGEFGGIFNAVVAEDARGDAGETARAKRAKESSAPSAKPLRPLR